MTRSEFEAAVLDFYGVRADYPFEDDLVTGVFRHTGSGKWFAIAMNIEKMRLGITSGGRCDVVNLKCLPDVIESLVGIERGIYPAYHMNKTHWLTLSLEECDEETVLWLLSASYDLTLGKKKQERIRKKRSL